jgi:hypothetical protein
LDGFGEEIGYLSASAEGAELPDEKKSMILSGIKCMDWSGCEVEVDVDRKKFGSYE